MRRFVGSAILVAFLSSPSPGHPAADEPPHEANEQAEQSVEEIVARYFQAIGGVEAVKAVASRRMSYSVHMLGRDPYLMEIHWTRPDSMRVGRPGSTTFTLTEGERSWRVGPEGRQELPEAIARSQSKLADIDGPLVDHEEKGVALGYSGAMRYDWTDLHQVTATFADGVLWEFFFDAGTGLLRRMTRPSFRMLDGQFSRGPDEHLYYFDYRSVDSVLYPHFWVQSTEDYTHLFVVEGIQVSREAEPAPVQ